MERTVQVEFETKERELVALNLSHLYKNASFIVFFLIAAANLVYMLAMLAIDGRDALQGFHVIQWFLLAFGLFIPFTTFFRATQAVKQRFKSERRTYTFDEQGFSFSTPSMQGSTTWAGVKRLSATKRMIVLYVGAKGVSLVPLRSFKSNADLQQVREWMAIGIDQRIYRKQLTMRLAFYVGLFVAAVLVTMLVLARQS